MPLVCSFCTNTQISLLGRSKKREKKSKHKSKKSSNETQNMQSYVLPCLIKLLIWIWLCIDFVSSLPLFLGVLATQPSPSLFFPLSLLPFFLNILFMELWQIISMQCGTNWLYFLWFQVMYLGISPGSWFISESSCKNRCILKWNFIPIL